MRDRGRRVRDFPETLVSSISRIQRQLTFDETQTVDPLEIAIEIRAEFGRTNSGVTFIREARPEQAATASGTEQKELLGKVLSLMVLVPE